MKYTKLYKIKCLSEEYLSGEQFAEGLAPIWTNNGVGFINFDGIEVIPCLFDHLPQNHWKHMPHMRYGFSGGISPVVVDGRCGMIDSSGNIIVPPKWESLSPIKNGRIAARMNEKWGFLDEKGEGVIPLIYDFVQMFSENHAFAVYNNQTVCINTDGEIIFNLSSVNSEYSAFPFSEGYAIVYDHHKAKYGAVDYEGKIVLPMIYQYLSSCKSGLFVACYDGKTEYIDRNGNSVIDATHDNNGPFFGDYAWFSDNGLFGCIDKFGNVVIPARYDMPIIFRDGLAEVKKDGKWGYINDLGDIVIPIIYDSVNPLVNGKAIVMKDNDVLLINILPQQVY